MKGYEQDIIIEQIVAFLNERASDEDTFSLQTWVTQSEEHRLYFAQIKNIYEMSGRYIDPAAIRSDNAIQKVFMRIAAQEQEQEQQKEKLRLKRTFRVGTWMQRAAAILFLPLLATSLYFYVQHGNGEQTFRFCETQAVTGSRSTITLPDRTVVWLNSGSKIRYPDRFTGDERVVYLEGEACFEVTSSEEHPFVVNTPTMEVRATGTKFHVADFEDNPVKEVSLLTGKVAIGATDDKRQTTFLLDLKPGQHLDYGVTDRSTRVTDGDTDKYFAWKDNKIVFRNDLMSDVVRRLSQLYGVEIELQGEELKNYRYRATFEQESLYEILRLLRLSAPIGFREVKRQQQADGTFTRPKVVIYPVEQNKK